jgi:uncharacterized protein
MSSIKGFIERHPLPAYFVLTFAISWGGFVLALGPAGFASTNWENDSGFLPAVMAMLAGPSVAGLLLTALLDGRPGLRAVLSRLLRWRVGAEWYAVALLPAPLLAAGTLALLSIGAPIYTAPDKAAVLLSGLMAGFSVVFEELGWTGFAVPRMRQRYSVLLTGLIVGVLWGAWHFLQQLYISGTYSAGLPVAVYLALSFFSALVQLTAYRVLMVWVYDRTESLLVVTLMHASLTASTVFIFRPEATGIRFLAFGWLFNAALCVIVAIVAVFTRGQLSREPHRTSPAFAG